MAISAELQDIIETRRKANESLSGQEILRLVAESYGRNVASYFDSRAGVDDPATLEHLSRAGAAFQAGELPLPLPVDAGRAIDLGGQHPNEAFYCVPVDFEKADELRGYLSHRLDYDAQRENTFASLMVYRTLDPVLTRKYKTWAFRNKHFMIVTRHESTDARKYLLDVVDERGIRTIYSLPSIEARAEKETAPEPDLSKYIPPATRRVPSILDGVRAVVDGRWKRLETRVVDSLILDSGQGQYLMMKGGRVTLHYRDGGGEHDDNVHPNAGSGSTAEVGGAVAPSGVIDITGGATDTGRTMYGPPDQASAASCHGYETTADCKACCVAYQIAALGVLGSAAWKCHGATCWWCPFCHIGCGLAEAVAAGLIIYFFEECKSNCDRPYWEMY